MSSDAKSSACPEYSAYLWTLFTSVLGIIYIAFHLSFNSKNLIKLGLIATLSVCMFILSDWNRIQEVRESYKNAEQGAVANPMGAFPVQLSHNYNLNTFVHHRSLPWVSYAWTMGIIVGLIFTLKKKVMRCIKCGVTMNYS